jgi:O-antigen/teichoic acid export membrane protein
VLNSLGPLFSSFRLRGDIAALKLSVERILTVFGILGVLGVATAYSFNGPIVRIALGPGYESVAPLLILFSIAGVLVGPGMIGRILAVIYNRPRCTTTAAALQLVVFSVLTLVLFPLFSSRGIAGAVIFATAVFSAYMTKGMRENLPYSLEHWLMTLGLGAVCAPLLLFWGTQGILPWGLFTILFVGLLFLFRVVSLKDLTSSWNAVRAASVRS